MKNFIPLVLFSLLVISQLSAQEKVDGAFEFDGLDREYSVYLPAGYTPGTPLPLVFNFHGITSSNAEQYAYTGIFGGFNDLANSEQFILCYPNGTKIPDDDGYEWNVGFSFSGTTADDVGFVNALIDTLYARYQINLDRVYATGMSNGGYMSYRLACELPERFQAIASVAGSIVPETFMDCYPGTSVPVMQIHNTADPVVLYDGFQHGVPIEEVIARWRLFNFCSESVDTFAFPDIDSLDGSTVEKYSWKDCYSNRQVLLYKVIGGDHTWPGSSIVFAPTNNDISASKEIWDFFNQYTQPIAVKTEAPLSLSEELLLSPNPFQEILTVQSKETPIASLKVYTATGQLVLVKENLHTYSYKLSLFDLNSGLYLVQAKTGKGAQVYKVVKE